jgi:predicted transcriptional regulator
MARWNILLLTKRFYFDTLQNLLIPRGNIMKPAELIKHIRLSLDMTQSEFAYAVEFKQSHIAKVETGQRAITLKLAQNVTRLAKSKKIKVSLLDLFPED